MIDEVAGITEAGPRTRNEDCYAFWRVGETFYAAVADGLGGMGGGGQASTYVVEFLKENAVGKITGSGDLVDLALDAHRGLLQKQAETPEYRAMATTLTMVGVRNNRLIAAHCGDTRLYIARRNGIKRLSEDHSEGERLFREGVISRKELFDYPRKNILESALGIKSEPKIQGIEFDLLPEDWILIASDGAYAKLTSAELRDLCRLSLTPNEVVSTCQKLIAQRQPTDNYTFVAAKVGQVRS